MHCASVFSVITGSLIVCLGGRSGKSDVIRERLDPLLLVLKRKEETMI